MPTINNATVATGTGLSTAGNGGRKLVRLENGTLVSLIFGAGVYYVNKSTDNGSTWSQVCYVQDPNSKFTSGGSMACKNNKVYFTLPFKIAASLGNVGLIRYVVDVTIQNNANIFATYTDLDSTVTLDIGTTSTHIEADEIHLAWSSKNSTYPNSFNIRYAKGTIAADGSVTWGAVVQVTGLNNSVQNFYAPNVSVKDNHPYLFFRYNNTFSSNIENSVIATSTGFTAKNLIYGGTSDGNLWGNRVIYAGASYLQESPSSIFIPQSINGLANGRLWVAWHGKDSTDSAKFNIRTSFSDDGGVTWSTPTKQTTGNLYDQTNASLTADAQGKVLLTWDAQNATTTQTALKVFSNGTWGATTTLTGDGYTNATTLFDNTFKLSMTTPPLIRQSTSGVYFSGNYFMGATVAPASGSLGDKTVPSVLSYTVTPESGSTITSLVEKVNGATVNTYSNPENLSRTFTIPPANWDALKYYNTQTISVTVTDSNGIANTQTYTFNKALSNDASLLEGAKAAKDGKDRISTKRDGIAGQVGLPAGSTFDAIMAQLASGSFMRVERGTFSSFTSGTLYSVNDLLFRPKLVFMHVRNGTQTFNMTITEDPFLLDDASISNYSISVFKNNDNYEGSATNLNADRSTNLSTSPGNYDGRITDNGFEFRPFVNMNKQVTYIALG